MKANMVKHVSDPVISGYHYRPNRSRHQTSRGGRASTYLYDDREHHRSRDP